MRTFDPVLLPEHVEHGTVEAYSNYECGCIQCKDSWNEYRTVLRRRRGTLSREELWESWRKHGRARYRKGCRCDECRDAEASYRRRYRANGGS